jgi:hypothetical protein
MADRLRFRFVAGTAVGFALAAADTLTHVRHLRRSEDYEDDHQYYYYFKGSQSHVWLKI